MLSQEDEAVVVAFRRHTLLPLDDCLYALQATILAPDPLIAASLPPASRHQPTAGGRWWQAQAVTLHDLHARLLPHRSGRGSHSRRAALLLVAIDRTTKFAFVELHEKATRRVAGDFLRHLIEAVPYKVHTVLTDNGTHFTTPGNVASPRVHHQGGNCSREIFRAHSFELACARNDIDHRLTKPRHPWTNGQVERMNRTIKDATVKRYHYDSHGQLRAHLADFVSAYNFARRLKTLRGLTPYEAICKAWSADPAASGQTRSTKCRDQTSRSPFAKLD